MDPALQAVRAARARRLVGAAVNAPEPDPALQAVRAARARRLAGGGAESAEQAGPTPGTLDPALRDRALAWAGQQVRSSREPEQFDATAPTADHEGMLGLVQGPLYGAARGVARIAQIPRTAGEIAAPLLGGAAGMAARHPLFGAVASDELRAFEGAAHGAPHARTALQAGGDQITDALAGLPRSPTAEGFQPGRMRWWTENLSEQVPQFAAALAVGGAPGVAVGVAQSFGLEAQEAFHGTRLALEQRDIPSGEAAALAAVQAIGVGVVNAALETLPMSELLTDTGIGRAALRKLGSEAWPEFVRRAATVGTTEATTEMAQEAAQMLGQFAATGDPAALDGWRTRMAAAGALGGAMGGGLGAVTAPMFRQQPPATGTNQQDEPAPAPPPPDDDLTPGVMPVVATDPSPPRGETITPEQVGPAPSQGAEGVPVSTTGAAETSRLESIPLAELSIDPHRFQFKGGTGEAGTTGAMRDVEKFDPALAGVVAVWTDPDDGRTYVVNGHHRYELAKRHGVERLNVIHIDAGDAREARVVGAMINIAEGRGTATDAAKLFREAGIDDEALKQRGVPLTESKARDGLALAALNDRLFGMVVSGQLTEARGSVIGASLPDHAAQDALMALLRRRERGGESRLTNDELGELVKFVRGAGETTRTEATLFGDDWIKQNLAVEKARLSAFARRKLGRDKRLFGLVARQSNAEDLARGGNVIDTAASGRIADEAELAGFVYDRVAGSVGPVSDALRAGAERLAHGEPFHAVASDTYAAVARALRGEVERLAPGATAAADAGPDHAGPPERREGPPRGQAGPQGVFGQEVVDAATGAQQELALPIPSPVAEEADRPRSGEDDRETRGLFGERAGGSPAIEEDFTAPQDIVLPIDRGASEETQLAQIAALTAENEAVIEEIIREVDAALGTSSKANKKAPGTIATKARRPSILAKKPWFSIAHIRDTYRFKTVINSLEDVPSILAILHRRGVSLVKIDTHKMIEPAEWGWRMAAFDLRMPNGQLVEYYTPLREVEEAKGEGHLIFEKWRDSTPEERVARHAEYRADVDASFNLYNRAWLAALQRNGMDEEAARAFWAQFEASLSSVTREKFSAKSEGEKVHPRDQAPAASLSKGKPEGAQTTTRPSDRSTETKVPSGRVPGDLAGGSDITSTPPMIGEPGPRSDSKSPNKTKKRIAEIDVLLASLGAAEGMIGPEATSVGPILDRMRELRLEKESLERGGATGTLRTDGPPDDHGDLPGDRVDDAGGVSRVPPEPQAGPETPGEGGAPRGQEPLPGLGEGRRTGGRGDEDERAGGEAVDGPEPDGPGEDRGPGPVGGGGRGRGGPAGAPLDLRARRDIPLAERDHRLTREGGEVAPRGDVARLNANLDAIELLKQLEGENRNATPEEKAVLARYTGWGWASPYLDERSPKHARWTERIAASMTPAEIASAKAATLNSHFTSIEVIAAMWDAVDRLGFSGGNVLEPAVGIGHFFGAMPPAMKGIGIRIGIDLDVLSARLAAKLYPQARIVQGSYESTPIANNSIDLAISNVPFGAFKIRADDYSGLAIHDYFFLRTLDKVRPGGLVAFITSHWTMDKANAEVRNQIADRADLVGAIRLPSTAFKGNASTEVTTDIIFLRKKGSGTFAGAAWRAIAQAGTYTMPSEPDVERPLFVNEYFVAHPEMVLGRHSMSGTMHAAEEGREYTLKPTTSGEAFTRALAEAVARLPAGVTSRPAEAHTPEPEQRVAEEGDLQDAHVVAEDGSVLVVEGQKRLTPEWLTRRAVGDAGYDAPIDAAEADRRTRLAREWIDLRNATVALHEGERADLPDDRLRRLRKALNQTYDAFVARWAKGRTHQSLNHTRAHLELAAFLASDPFYALVLALEEEVTTTNRRGVPETRYTKGPIFRDRQFTPRHAPTSAGSIDEAITISLGWHNEVRSDLLGSLLGIPTGDAERAALETGRVFRDPQSGTLAPRERYLSGNVRKKLAAARAAAKDDNVYAANVVALEAVQPETVPFTDITLQLGSRWVPGAVYERFVADVLGGRAEITYHQAANRFSVASSPITNPDFNTPDANAIELLRHALNGTSPQYTITDRGPPPTTRADVDRTLAAEVAVKRLKDAFVEWTRTAEVLMDWRGRRVLPQVAIEEAYNDTNNSVVPPVYDGSYLIMPGMTDYVRRTPHRMSFIARVLQEGSAVQAHGVGSGKTLGQIAATMEMRRLGLARRPLIVVQKATITQFAAAFAKAYPHAKVLVATERTFQAKHRKRLLGRIASGDFDAIIVTQPQFDRIPNRPGSIVAYLGEKIRELEDILLSIDGKDKKTLKEIEAAKKTLENKMRAAVEEAKKRMDRGLAWEDLGVDAILIDEAHAYKRAPIVTRKTRVKGIPTQFSNRAMAAEIKIQQIHRATGGRNVILSTGTPITNTTAEAYVMLRLATPRVLAEYNITNFDDFADTFGTTSERTEWSWSGNFRRVTRFDRFINGPELIKMIRSGFDVRLGNKELGLKVPEIRGGKPELVIVPQTPSMEALNAWVDRIGARFEALEGKERREASWVPIVTMGMGLSAAVDPRLIDPSLPDEPGSKVNTAVERVLEIWNRTRDFRGVQLIFVDRFSQINTDRLAEFERSPGSTASLIVEGDLDADDSAAGDDAGARAAAEGQEHRDTGRFNVYRDIKRKLIAAGVPEAEIAIVHDADTDAKREKLFDAVNAGEVRIVLGSTEKAGVGVNIQQRLIAEHHLDPPRTMTPAMMEQRIGRIIRQHEDGTLPDYRREVEIIFYGTERSMDTGIYQKLEAKQVAIAQALSGTMPGRTFEDAADEVSMTFAEMKAHLTGDDRVIREVDLSAQVASLVAEKGAHDRSIGQWRRRQSDAAATAQIAQSAIETRRRTAAALAETLGDMDADLRMKLFERTAAGRKDVTDLLDSMLAATLRHAKTSAAGIGTGEAALNGLKLTIESKVSSITKEEKTFYGLAGPDVEIGGVVTTGRGILASIAGYASAERLTQATEKLARDAEQFATDAKRAAEKASAPWPRADELRSLEAELDALRRDLAGETPTPQTPGVQPRPAPPGSGGGRPAPHSPSGGPDVFSTDPARTGNDVIRRVQMPELVRLAKALMGHAPTLKAFRRSRGMFYPKGRGDIKIDRELAADPIALAQTLAHEIGHLVDYLPDQTLERGNIVARIHSVKPMLNKLGKLRGWMRQRHAAGGHANKEIRQELLALTEWWSGPLGGRKDPRRSPRELYADALSVLLNAPFELKARAPTFFDDFLAFIDSKPEVKDAYLEIQDLLAGTPATLASARRADIREAFAQGETIIRARAEERRRLGTSVAGLVKQILVDTAGPVIAYEKKAKRAGITPDLERSARAALEELAYRDNVNHLMLDRIQAEVADALTRAGLTTADAGEYLMLRRIESGDRSPLANPFGYTPETALDQLQAQETELGHERWRALEAAVARFHAIVFESVEKAVAVGSYNEKTFKETIEPNRDRYATFAVLEYLTDEIAPGVKIQLGTFKEIASPFTATIMKTVALNRLNELQVAKRSVIDMLEKHWPTDISRAEDRRGPEGILLPPRPPAVGREHLVILEDGRPAYYEVDPYVAKVFQTHDIGLLSRAGRAFGSAVYGVFHPLYVTLSPSWQVFNLVRDIKRTYKLLAEASAGQPLAMQGVDAMLDLLRVPAAYARGAGSAAKLASRERDPRIQEMLADRAVGAPRHGFDFRPVEEEHFDRMLARYGLMPNTPAGRSRLRAIATAVPRGLEWMGIFLEALPKVAAWEVASARGIDGRRRAEIVRNKAGTPNTRRRGLATDLTNPLFMYSNVILQGYRADYEVAVSPRTAAGYWLRAALTDLLPKLAMIAAIYGLFGDDVEEWLKAIPEYDLAKYLVVPLGWATDPKTGDRKAVYLRIPHDDTSRLLAGAMYLASAGRGASGWKDALGVVFGELPSLSPPVDIAGKWIEYLSGVNPRDSFRGRDVVPRDAWAAGGWYATEAMAGWTFNQFGVASSAVRWWNKGDGGITRQLAAERVIGSIPGVSRLIGISDRGISERQWIEMDLQARERARFKLGLPEEVRALTRERWRLAQVRRTLDERDSRRLGILNEWYRDAYLPLTQAIDGYAGAGQADDEKEMRRRLAEITERVLTTLRDGPAGARGGGTGP